jgi:hypothetical protein
MGSIRFYEDQRITDIDFAFILDLVGHDVPIPGISDLVAVTGIESHPGAEQLITEVDCGDSLRVLPILNQYVGDMSDHHIFRVNKVPYLFFSCGRWQHYHSHTDTPEKLSYTKMESLVGYISRLVEGASRWNFRTVGSSQDTTLTELKFADKYLGDFLRERGRSVPGSRTEMNELVQYLLGMGL